MPTNVQLKSQKNYVNNVQIWSDGQILTLLGLKLVMVSIFSGIFVPIVGCFCSEKVKTLVYQKELSFLNSTI